MAAVLRWTTHVDPFRLMFVLPAICAGPLATLPPEHAVFSAGGAKIYDCPGYRSFCTHDRQPCLDAGVTHLASLF